MNLLVARDALTSGLARVSSDRRAGNADATVFAVFESEDPGSRLLGVVTTAETTRFPQRIFADLLPKVPGRPVFGDTDLDTIWLHMEDVHANALPVVDGRGDLLGAVTRESLWVAMLAQQRAMLAEVAMREVQHLGMLHAIPDDFVCLTADGLLLEVTRSKAATRSGGTSLWPLASENSIGKHLSDVFPSDATRTLMEGVQRCLDSKAPCSASFTIGAGDAAREYEARFSSWGEANVLVVCRNVTELHALRAKLEIADRMIALGTLAAGVAHELNNPLTYVSASLELLQELLVSEIGENKLIGDARPLLEEMREGLKRVQNTVRDLKLFSRSDEHTREPLDVTRILELSIKLAHNEIRHRARLTRDFGEVPAVHANEGQLGQVFLNLLMNAAQSIAEGSAAVNEIHVVVRADPAGRVVVEVRDTGTGFSDEIRARIFQPFFTTKAMGLGTGLGLSICHGIVVAHGGSIEVESTVGKGSVFRVILPATAAPPPPRSSLPPRLAVRPVGRFLVIDDEQAIARTYSRLLGTKQCVTCLSGAEAIALVRNGERFDAIICDLMMPETSGIDVYDELVRIAPDEAKRIIFVTGGAFTDRTRHFLRGLLNPVIAKPFDAARLFGSVARVIQKAGPRTGDPGSAPSGG